jgi:hypothetical protein
VEQHRFEIKIWPLGLNLKFCRATLPANGFDIEVPILVGTKRDSRAVLGINDTNVLLVHKYTGCILLVAKFPITLQGLRRYR